MMRRFNMKVVLSLVLVGALFLTMNFWSKCSDISSQDANFYRESGIELHQSPARDLNGFPGDTLDHHDNINHDNDNRDSPAPGLPYEAIDCNINGEYNIACRRDETDVYIPFSFIAKYFEVYGKLEKHDGIDRFDFHHSYSKVYAPDTKYTPGGIFMSFEHYNVEVRDRVKCISAIDGVPISTQWGPQGYHYPIQIAQYGLSHYSKYLTDQSRKVMIVEDAEDGHIEQWSVLDSTSSVQNILDPVTETHIIEFNTAESPQGHGVTIPVNNKDAGFFFGMDFKFVSNGSVTVTVETKGKPISLYNIHYTQSHTLIDIVNNDIYYGMGERLTWSNIQRDIATDLHKGVLLLKGGKKRKTSLHKVISVTFRGHGFVDNITLSTNVNLAQFYYAANWLVLHQDDKGGWPIYVTRKLASGKLELPPGWYSAMAQGQAMSLLVRAFLRTNNPKYLNSAVKAMRLFEIPSEEGGVLATFAEKYSWYEEYPTMPHSFVLNGFIYSLLGLYDLKSVAPREEALQADKLYQNGLESLKTMLPLFDTGSGSIYDLRHFTLGSAPNLARWDYHATHVNQLLLLATVEDDSIFADTAKRWLSYMSGQRAPHN